MRNHGQPRHSVGTWGLIILVEQKLHRREARSQSHHAVRCRRRDLQGPEG